MEKHCMPYHWPLRATKVATSILAIQTLAFLPKWYFYNLEIIVILNSSISHTYLNIKINNQGKHCMSDHWPLTATKIATNILKIQT